MVADASGPADPEKQRVKSRRYYAANRERVIARVKKYQAEQSPKSDGSEAM